MFLRTAATRGGAITSADRRHASSPSAMYMASFGSDAQDHVSRRDWVASNDAGLNAALLEIEARNKMLRARKPRRSLRDTAGHQEMEGQSASDPVSSATDEVEEPAASPSFDGLLAVPPLAPSGAYECVRVRRVLRKGGGYLLLFDDAQLPAMELGSDACAVLRGRSRAEVCVIIMSVLALFCALAKQNLWR